jgi:4-amino-4-deoxy-L-arabinose transferase-like glycosyltransferase
MKKLNIKIHLIKNDPSFFIFIVIFITSFLLRIISAIKMGWLAEDVFFIDNIEKWFAHNFFQYFFQWNHHFFPPRSPEFGTPPLGMWFQTIGVYLAERFNFSELFGARIITILFSQIGLAYIYKIGKDFFNSKVALLSSFFVAITPSIIAIDSSAHVDTFLYVFLVICIYYLMRFLKNKQYYFLYIASCAAGFSILVKVYAWIIVGFLGVLLFFFFLKNRLRLINLFYAFLIIFLIPIFLWAGFRDPDHLLRTFHVVEKIGSFTGKTGVGGLFSEYNGVVGYDSKSPFYNVMMIFGKNLPLVSLSFLSGIIIFLVAFINKKRNFFQYISEQKKQFLLIGFYIILIHFITIYFLAGPNAVFNRILFSSIIYIIIATVFLEYIISKCKKRIIPFFIYGLVIIISFMPVLKSNPALYNAYNNFLIGGTRGASTFYRVGHGEGLDLAANYLNIKAPKNSLIYAPRVNFISKYLRKDLKLAYAPLNEDIFFALSQGSEYVVLHNSFFSGGLQPQIGVDLLGEPLTYSVDVGTFPYVKIFKLNPYSFFNKNTKPLNFRLERAAVKTANSSVNYSTSVKNEIVINYSLAKGDYAYAIGPVSLDTMADGLLVTLEGVKSGEKDNLYIDLGLKNVGYFRQSVKYNWVGEHSFFILFKQMQNFNNQFNIYDSNYLKISVDTSDDNLSTGSFIIKNISLLNLK